MAKAKNGEKEMPKSRYERSIEPIATIHTDFPEKFGIPRQSGRIPELIGKIIFEPKYRSVDAVKGLSEFSHIWLIFDFSLSHRDTWSATVRPPRLGGNKRIGVFASRSPFRPNNLGLSSVKLLGVEISESDGPVLTVSGADLLDKTPIYDIKPYISYSDSHPDAVCSYSDDHKADSLTVIWQEGVEKSLPYEIAYTIERCIAEDPRPSYKSSPGDYGMRFSHYNIKFSVNGGTATIHTIENLSDKAKR